MKHPQGIQIGNVRPPTVGSTIPPPNTKQSLNGLTYVISSLLNYGFWRVFSLGGKGLCHYVVPIESAYVPWSKHGISIVVIHPAMGIFILGTDVPVTSNTGP